MLKSLHQSAYLTYIELSSLSKVRSQQLWGKNKEDLQKQLDDLKQELVSLRTQKIAGGAQSKLSKMYVRQPRFRLE